MYLRSISAVGVLSLYVPDVCPLHPLILICPCSRSMSLCRTLASSLPSVPISCWSVKITTYLCEAFEIIAFTLSRLGISGVCSSTL